MKPTEFEKNARGFPQVCSSDRFATQIDLLKRLAGNSDMTHKHAACSMKGGKVIAVGVNKYFQIRSSQNSLNLSVHAEMDVLVSTSAKLSKGMDILIIRLSKSRMLHNSRPCNACIDKLKQRGIRKAYYSNAEGQIVYEFVDSMSKLHVSSGCKAREHIQSLCL